MKQLRLFSLLMVASLVIWGCGKKPDGGSATSEPKSEIREDVPPVNVISIADLLLQAKIQSADVKKIDTTWLNDLYWLKDLDRNLLAKFDEINELNSKKNTDRESKGGFLATANTLFPTSYRPLNYCCACGSGCCKACDTTLNSQTVGAVSLVQSISFGEKPNDEKTLQPVENKDGLKLFKLNTALPNGTYYLTVKTTLPGKRTIVAPVMIHDNHIMLSRDHQQ